MTRMGFLAAVTFAALLPLAAHAEEPMVIAAPAAIKWMPAPPAAGLPKGAKVVVLFGDPAKAEPFATRTEIPAGAKIAPHTHPNDENVTVVSGGLHVGLGEKFDTGKGTLVKAGGFIRLPKGTPHYAWTTEATVIQSNSVGPSGRTFVNPADAPKTN
jgi:quercetin dioxygenase-like cupin family protein